MSTLKTLEKLPFEDVLQMSGGYVLDFTDQTFAAFFDEAVDIDIDARKYHRYGTSKAKRLRAFWEVDSDSVVGKALAELLDIWEYKNPEPSSQQKATVSKCRQTVERLLGQTSTCEDAEARFLERDLGSVSLKAVKIEPQLIPILESRLREARRGIESKSNLSVVILCGSVLEGLLLGTAISNPQHFNQAPNSPKDKSGKVKQFQEWSLAQFIDVACALGYLHLDVKKFSHALRDFRNYIHPFQQLSSGFSPDQHTAKICLQVLRAAVASLSGER